MLSADLTAVLRINQMAEAAAEDVRGEPTYPASYEAAQAYVRLREDARRLNERAGWSEEDFDRELPMPDFGELPDPSRSMHPRIAYKRAAATGPRARVLLGQLAAWAAGHVEAFEVEARLKAEAEAKLSQKPKRGPAGFAP